jgi:cell division protein FtsW (lipid II flippase)
MIDSFKTILTNWKTATSDRTKLQHTYIAAGVAFILAAGIVGLVNYDMGQSLLAVAIICAGIFLANAVIWSLLQSAVLLRLGAKHPAKRKK